MRVLDTMLAWDESALRRIHTLPRRPAIDRIMQAITRLGDASSWVGIALITSLFGRQGRRYAVRATLAVLGATAISGALKRLLNRPRPREHSVGVQPLLTDPDAFSFPSGHTAAAVACATALTGTPLAGGAWPFATVMAMSRVYLGAHYPLDVLVGAMIGAGTGIAAHLIPVD